MHTADLLICRIRHFKPNLVTHSYVAKFSPEILKYHRCQPFLQPVQLIWLHMHGVSFTLKLSAKFLAYMLCMATTIHHKFVMPVSGLLLMVGRSTNQKQVATCASTSVVFTLGRRHCTLAVALHWPSHASRDCLHNVLYTRVKKRMRSFSKLQGNMRIIPNMRLIAKEKLTTP